MIWPEFTRSKFRTFSSSRCWPWVVCLVQCRRPCALRFRSSSPSSARRRQWTQRNLCNAGEHCPSLSKKAKPSSPPPIKLTEKTVRRQHQIESEIFLNYQLTGVILLKIDMNFFKHPNCCQIRVWRCWKASIRMRKITWPPEFFTPPHPLSASSSGLNQTHRYSCFFNLKMDLIHFFLIFS